MPSDPLKFLAILAIIYPFALSVTEGSLKLYTLICCIFCLFLAGFAGAQKIGEAPNPVTPKVKHAAVLPLLFFRDKEVSRNDKAIKSCTDELDAVFNKYGIDKVDLPHVNIAYQKICGQVFDEKSDQIPKAEDLVALGHELGVDYVVFARCRWHVKSVWVGLGPKTKADATVDLWIVDVAKSEFSLKSEGIKADDTKKEEALGIALDFFVAPVTFVSGGPETPHMQRSGQIAFIEALKPWIQKQNQIQAGG